VDNGAALTYLLVGGSSAYGVMAIDANGAWSFTNDPGALDALGEGATATATFQAVVTDEHGASSETVDIVVNLVGVNDIAEATDDEASVTEDSGSYAVSGTVVVEDRDAGESAFATVGDLNGAYGVFTFAEGAWSYTLDNDNSYVNALNAGQSLIDTLVVKSLDESDSSTITVTINGADALPPPPDVDPPPPEEAPNFMFNFGKWQSENNVYDGFGADDTLYYANELTFLGVSHADYNGDGNDDAIVSFSYTGNKPGSAPEIIEAVLTGVTFEPDVEIKGNL
jgi:VCBS repeat-containing protein